MTFIIFSTILVVFLLYYRYFPVLGVRFIHIEDIDLSLTKIVDVRDYNVSYKDPVRNSINIPIAYLKRNYNEIPNGNVYVIASGLIEKNMAIRFFRKKGFRVIGYSFIDQRMKKDDECNCCIHA